MRFETTPPPAPSWDKHLEPEVSAQLVTGCAETKRELDEYAKRMATGVDMTYIYPATERYVTEYLGMEPTANGCYQSKRELHECVKRMIDPGPDIDEIDSQPLQHIESLPRSRSVGDSYPFDPDPENDGLDVVS